MGILQVSGEKAYVYTEMMEWQSIICYFKETHVYPSPPPQPMLFPSPIHLSIQFGRKRAILPLIIPSLAPRRRTQ